MINELEILLPDFSAVNHTRCFLHVNNLVARTLVKQFDVKPKTRGKASTGEEDSSDLEDREDEDVLELAGDMEYEERTTGAQSLEEAEENLDDDVNGWVDEMAAMSQAERRILKKTTRPVKMVLVKVSVAGQRLLVVSVWRIVLTLYHHYRFVN
jgi:hypothetical protein